MLYRVKGKWSIVNYRTKRGPRDLKTKWGPRAFFKVLDKHLRGRFQTDAKEKNCML
jgi:hypothetical protein